MITYYNHTHMTAVPTRLLLDTNLSAEAKLTAGRLHRSEGEDGLLELRQRGERARGALMGAARSFSFRPSAAHRTCRNRPCCVQYQ